MTARQVPFAAAVSTDERLQGLLRGVAVEWIPALTCSVEFPKPCFLLALEDIISHPEYNSSIILRAEIVNDTPNPDLGTLPVAVAGFVSTRHIFRRILPRRPDRDGSLSQDCVFFASSSDGACPDDSSAFVGLVPQLETGATLPFYHPDVSAIGFKHDLKSNSGQFTVTVYIIPSSASDDSFCVPHSRLYRICASLLESIWRIGFGRMTGYQKKVEHDVIIDRAEYQDFYLIMRERHKSLVNDWKLDTDPLKHVYEDIGIAAFIILLWKHTYPPLDPVEAETSAEPWTAWGRPTGGWVDIGCGNGLLVHILVSMGYLDGLGVDLRARPNWDEFPPITRARLQVHAIDPTAIDGPISLPSFIRPQGFLIGNHSDELTPWIPILATLSNSHFLSIPCCTWALDAKFNKPKGFHKRIRYPAEEVLERKLVARGPGDATSMYSTYLAWLYREAIEYGFEVESEVLRIPSSKNWAIVGRKRMSDAPEQLKSHQDLALAKIQLVRTKGVFKPRIPEGKAGHGHR